MKRISPPGILDPCVYSSRRVCLAGFVKQSAHFPKAPSFPSRLFASRPILTVPIFWLARFIWPSFGLGPKIWLAHASAGAPAVSQLVESWRVGGGRMLRQRIGKPLTMVGPSKHVYGCIRACMFFSHCSGYTAACMYVPCTG